MSAASTRSTQSTVLRFVSVGCRWLSLISRVQHHCRICGKAVCDGCSQKRSTFPRMGYELEQRMCSTCFETIKPEEYVLLAASFIPLRSLWVHFGGPSRTPLVPDSSISDYNCSTQPRAARHFVQLPGLIRPHPFTRESLETSHRQRRSRYQGIHFYCFLSMILPEFNIIIVLYTRMYSVYILIWAIRSVCSFIML